MEIGFGNQHTEFGMLNRIDLTSRMEAIGRTPLFSGLPERDLEELARLASERNLTRGAVLFMPGEGTQGIFVVVRGTIRTFRGSARREQVIDVEHAGTTIGEAAIFDDGHYAVGAAAEEDCSILFISKQDFQQVLLKHPQVALSALQLLARRLRRDAELVESLSLQEVGQRLVRFLLLEARTNGHHGEHGWELELKFSKRQMAERLGTVREVISRKLKRLKEQGLVEIDGRRLTIRDGCSNGAWKTGE